MTAPRKPRHHSDYRREETEQVEAACLTVAVTLGALMDRLCIVGGLVPSLIIDREIGPDPETGAQHSGTNDLDVGLAIALLDDHQYTEISKRLRQEGFAPDVNEPRHSDCSPTTSPLQTASGHDAPPRSRATQAMTSTPQQPTLTATSTTSSALAASAICPPSRPTSPRIVQTSKLMAQ